jgi:hypothetical protein
MTNIKQQSPARLRALVLKSWFKSFIGEWSSSYFSDVPLERFWAILWPKPFEKNTT